MKIKFLTSRLARFTALGLALSLVAGLHSAIAAPLYWDTNGVAAGNGADNTGVWGTSTFWAAASGGTNVTGAYTAGSDVFFSAVAAAAGPTAVAITGTQDANSITVNQSSNLTISAGTALQIGGGGITKVNGTGTLAISTPIQLTASQA